MYYFYAYEMYELATKFYLELQDYMLTITRRLKNVSPNLINLEYY